MGFAAVGMVMLAIVLLFYLRMISTRSSRRKPYNAIQATLERASVFESVADDKSALKEIEAALIEHPDNPQLQARLQEIRQRLQPRQDSHPPHS